MSLETRVRKLEARMRALEAVMLAPKAGNHETGQPCRSHPEDDQRYPDGDMVDSPAAKPPRSR